MYKLSFFCRYILIYFNLLCIITVMYCVKKKKKASYVLNAYLYCVNALVGGAISIRDPYICAVTRVCANESDAVSHWPVVCAVKT